MGIKKPDTMVGRLLSCGWINRGYQTIHRYFSHRKAES